MAGKYSSKETKYILDKHSENLKKIENIIALPQNYGKRIADFVYYMIESDTFRRMVLDDFENTGVSYNEQFAELIKSLYLFKRVTKQSIECKHILQDNKERIADLMKEASPGSNSILRMFSSSKKKQNYDDAIEKLENEISGSYYWSSSQKVLSAVNDNSNVTETDALNDFAGSAEEYKNILKRNLPDNAKVPVQIDEITDLITSFNKINKKLDAETSKTDAIETGIRKAAERMVMAAVLDILKTVPIEEINREKGGFRVKTLRDEGYTNIADVYIAADRELSSVYGIGEDTAAAIKEIAGNFAAQAKQNAKIKLSVDNKTKEAEKLVSEIYNYKRYSDALKELKTLESEYKNNVAAAISDVEKVDNGIFWRFFNEDKRKNIKDSYKYLQNTLAGDYGDRVKRITKTFQNVSSLKATDVTIAWKDFENNSIAYINILESIAPGVLGNDDRLYGLPEDLAREIQDESLFSDGLNCELRRYQEWGVKYILHQERVLLGDEMGLGKTIQAIAAMVSLKNAGATHFIVVCPASVLPNWIKEVSAKSKLRVTKVHGPDKEQSVELWIKNGGVAVTTYETTGIFSFAETFGYDLLVVDEAHFIKNENAMRSKNVRRLSEKAQRLLFMTGTALENKVNEMISLIDVLRPDVAKSVRTIAFMAQAPQFREKIADVYYRRKREDVLTELPDLIESREWCTMSDAETAAYEEAVLKRNYMAVRRLSWDADDLNDSCKAGRMMEIITEAESEGRKVLVFSFFRDTINKICDFLGDRCCGQINGSVPPGRRQEIIEQFGEDQTKTVLCAQILAGGTGLNIQTASVVIICEPQFKPSTENQAISRAYRMGQARNVLVYRLLCEDTIDERVTEILEEKQKIFDAFADESVAAEETTNLEKEMDDETFGKIIEEEVERIKAKYAENQIRLNSPTE